MRFYDKILIANTEMGIFNAFKTLLFMNVSEDFQMDQLYQWGLLNAGDDVTLNYETDWYPKIDDNNNGDNFD